MNQGKLDNNTIDQCNFSTGIREKNKTVARFYDIRQRLTSSSAGFIGKRGSRIGAEKHIFSTLGNIMYHFFFHRYLYCYGWDGWPIQGM